METRKEFTKWVYKFGIISTTALLILMLAFPVSISIVYKVWPSFSQLWPAIITLTLMLAPWWPAECLGYMTTLGPGALYLSYTTGNVTNLRMPVTVGSINSLNIEPNSDECHTIAIIACGASNLATITCLFIGLVLSVPLYPVLTNPSLQPAFNYTIPALFGGLVAQAVLKNKKQFILYLFPLIICLMFCFLTKVNSAYYMIFTVLSGALVFYIFDYRKKTDKSKN